MMILSLKSADIEIWSILDGVHSASVGVELAANYVTDHGKLASAVSNGAYLDLVQALPN